jgi:hypothetical protein
MTATLSPVKTEKYSTAPSGTRNLSAEAAVGAEPNLTHTAPPDTAIRATTFWLSAAMVVACDVPEEVIASDSASPEAATTAPFKICGLTKDTLTVAISSPLHFVHRFTPLRGAHYWV